MHWRTQSSNVVNFTPPRSILVEPETPLPRFKLLDTAIDVLALLAWGLLTLVTATAIFGSIFILIFFASQ